MKWVTRRKFNKIAAIIGIIALLLATVMGVFTFFGANGNNFVISFAPDEKYNIALFSTEDKNVPLTRLAFEGLNDMNNITYDTGIPENIEDGIGSKNEKIRRSYMAFSYYLSNLSNVPVDIAMSMEITKVTKNVDAAARVMVIVNGEKEIYAKLQQAGPGKDTPEHISTQESPLTTPFVNNKMILSRSKNDPANPKPPLNLQPNEHVKITIVFWLEGWDAQCTDDIKGGILRAKMDLWVE